jgi:hypothetical protein
MIHFQTTLFKIAQWTILQLPEEASAKLPSRGQVMVKGTINGHELRTVLEPDGKWSHWFKVNKELRETLGVEAGDTVSLAIESIKDWPEPEIPKDLRDALAADPQAHDRWMSVTPPAHWDWIRWISGTKNADTRAKRIRVSLSKLKAGEKRPCCFNRSMCTDPYVSKGGRLLGPGDV